MLRPLQLAFSCALIALVAPFSGGCRSKSAPTPPDAGASMSSKLGFRLSEGEPERPPARVTVKGAPLATEAVDRLLARVPKVAASEPDQATARAFALRDASKPVPRPGRAIEEPFPPKAPPPRQSVGSAADVTVTRHAPEGEVAVAPNFSVSFSEPMVALSTVEALAARPSVATLTPASAAAAAKGEWRWLGTQTLIFQPERELPKATDYVVEIPAGTRSVVGHVLAHSERFAFSTPPPKLVDSWPNGDDRPVDTLLLAEFDQKVDPAALIALVRVRGDGLDYGARLAKPAEIAASGDITRRLAAIDKAGVGKRGHAFVFKAEHALPMGAAVWVEFPAGIPSAEGPRKSVEPQGFRFVTHVSLGLTEVKCWGACYPGSAIEMGFTGELDEAAFDKRQVVVSPEVPELEVVAHDRGVVFYGKFKSGLRYRFTAKKGIKSRQGDTLAEDAFREVAIAPYTPYLYPERTSLTVVDPAATARMPIFTRNETSVRVQLYRTRPELYPAYLKFRSQWDNEKASEPVPPGELVFDRDVVIDPKIDGTTETPVDLAPALSGGFGNVVAIVDAKHPYKQRSERQWSRQWIQVTSLGITAHEASDGSLLLLAAGLDRGEPLAGVAFSLLGGPVLATSGADGMAHTGALGPFDGPPVSLIARRGADAAFMPGLHGDWRVPTSKVSFVSFDDRGLYKPGEVVRIKGLLRRVDHGKGWEVDVPRELVGRTLPFVVRDARSAEVARGTSKVDDAGGLFAEFKLPSSANLGPAWVEWAAIWSNASHAFQIQEFRRPEYEVSTRATAGPHVVGGFAEVTVEASYFGGGGLSQSETAWQVVRQDAQFVPPGRADYVFGREPERRGWYWDGDRDARTEADPRAADWQGRTDARGAHRLRIDFEGTSEPFAFTLNARATVTDVNRQAWSSATDVLVHPARIYAGLKLDKPFVLAGDAIEMHAIAVDLEGKPAAGRKIRLTGSRLVGEWNAAADKWVTTRVDTVRCEFSSTEADVKACPLPTRLAGRYEIVADLVDDAGRANRTVVHVWAAGKLSGRDRSVAPDALELTPDHARYRPGDVAHVLVRAPFAPAEGIVEVSGGVRPRRTRVRLEERAQSIDVPIEVGDVPSLTLTVSVVGQAPRFDSHGEIDPQQKPRPAHATGATTLTVPPDDHKLALELTPKKKALLPGEDNVVAIDVRDATGAGTASEVALIVADEAVLSLVAYRLVDPLARFYAGMTRRSRVTDLRHYVTLAPSDDVRHSHGDRTRGSNVPSSVWGSDDTFGGGGIGLGNIGTLGYGGGAAQAEREAALANAQEFGMIGLLTSANDPAAVARAALPQITLRKNFDALAVFASRVVTDAAGHAEVAFKMPDSTSRFRVMGVVWDKRDRFGSGESSITTRLPLVIRPSAPRFLNYGDRVEFPVVVQNQTDEPMRVSLAARAENASFDDGVQDAQGSRGGRVFDVAPNDRVEVRLPARARSPGRAQFQFVAESETGRASDAANVDLPVWTPATTEAFATYGVVDDDAVRHSIVMPNDVAKEFGGLEVSTSSTALFALSDAVVFLQKYPFECNEQLASRVLSIVALRDVLAAFHTSALPDAEKLRAGVARDLAALEARQDPSTGGFAFWSGETWPFVTAHVALAVAIAKEKGFAVDATMSSRLERYLETIDAHIPSSYSIDAQRSIRAFALFVQKRLGHPNAARAKALVEEAGVATMPLESLAWVLPTLAGDPSTAKLARDILVHFSNRVVETAGAAHFTTDYGEADYLVLSSDHRTDALVLLALLEADPKSDLLPKIVAGLLGGRRQGHWLSTQEDAFVLLALDAYFERFEKVAPSFVARVWLGDRAAADHAFRGFNVDRAETLVPMAELPGSSSDLVVGKEGRGRLYYRLGVRYAPTSLASAPLDRGFSVTRTYEPTGDASSVTRAADGTWHVKSGATVRVRLTMVALSERHHVALVDPMPAGFEALDSALAGAPPVPSDPTAGPAESTEAQWLWRARWYEHDNLRDERAEAFTSRLPAGVYEYMYFARATTPGSFVVPALKAEEMYAPETFGRAASDRVIVEAPL